SAVCEIQLGESWTNRWPGGTDYPWASMCRKGPVGLICQGGRIGVGVCVCVVVWVCVCVWVVWVCVGLCVHISVGGALNVPLQCVHACVFVVLLEHEISAGY